MPLRGAICQVNRRSAFGPGWCLPCPDHWVHPHSCTFPAGWQEGSNLCLCVGDCVRDENPGTGGYIQAGR